MLNKSILALGMSVIVLSLADEAGSHCQIPCGIYNDHARVLEMWEHYTTIDKSVRKIKALAGKADAQSANQLARWVHNKEQHAEKIIRIISDYFLAQKIKPVPESDKQGYKKYLKQLRDHHSVLVAAMKCKQSADLGEVSELARSLGPLKKYWPAKK